MEPAPMRHGGDLSWASRRYGIAQPDWLDLSTGINPRPWPWATAMAVADLAFERLPGGDELELVLDAARQAYGVPLDMPIVPAPGSEAIIRSLPRLIAGPAALVTTSYASYAEAWRQSGRRLRPADSAAEAAADAETSVLLVNPNNPDGRLVRPGDIFSIAGTRRGSAIVVVDEAYADVENGLSVAPRLGAGDPVLVIRSFGKFFGLPGLRLGFAIGPEPIVNRVETNFGDWPLSSAALAIGTRALTDLGWQREARRWLAVQARRLNEVLAQAGLAVEGGTHLFCLVRHADARGLHERLGARGVWTRIWPDSADLLRFGLPPDEAGLARLKQALGEAVRR